MEQQEATIPVTGIGSMPGQDADEATRTVVGELDIPHLVELPARGPGGDMLGRTLALVHAATGEFAAETTPSGWRLAGGRAGGEPGRFMRRGEAWLGEDCDRLEEHLIDFSGHVKVQVVGPWTLAAGLESVRGHRVVADPGACVELAAGLAEALAGQVLDIGRRVPGASVVVQVDEPALPSVLAGHLRTPSGRGAVRVPELPELAGSLAAVIAGARAAGATSVVAHSCASAVPFDLLGRSGFDAVSIDLAALGGRADEDLGAWWDRGGSVVLGVVPALDPGTGPSRPSAESTARGVAALLGRIGFGMAEVGERTWLSPACGLAGASPSWARSVGALLRGTARLLETAE